MTSPIRLCIAREQRTRARDAALDAAETPEQQLGVQLDYLRSVTKLAVRVDPEAAAAITKRAVEAVSLVAAEMAALIENGTSDTQAPANRAEPLDTS